MKSQGFAWKVDNRLPQASDELRDAMHAVVTKAVLDIQGNAVASAPVGRTGLLKSGVQAILPEDTGGDVSGGIGTNTEYGAYVELGTGRAGSGSFYPYDRTARYTSSWPGMAARAFIGNAAKRVEPSYTQAMSRLGDLMPRKA
jgi:hypothetical protein